MCLNGVYLFNLKFHNKDISHYHYLRPTFIFRQYILTLNLVSIHYLKAQWQFS